MMNAVCYRCRTLTVALLSCLLWMPVGAAELDKSDPDMGFHVAAQDAGAGATQASKLDKLNQSIRQGAEDYRLGRFDRAVAWYEAALRLEPGRPDLVQSLANARQMRDAQAKALGQLPKDPTERERFLSIAYKQAEQYLTNGQFEQATQAFYKLWVTVGDYQGKTLASYRRAQQSLAERNVPDQAGSNPGEAQAAPVSTAQPAAVAAQAAATAEVIMEGIMPPAGAAEAAQMERQVAQASTTVETIATSEASTVTTATIEPASAAEPTAITEPAATEGEMIPAATNGAVPVVEGPDDLTRLQANRLLRQAELLAGEGKVAEANATLSDALALWPDNPKAVELQAQLAGAPAAGTSTTQSSTATTETLTVVKAGGERISLADELLPPTATSGSVSEIQKSAELHNTLNELHRKALEHYDAGDIGKSREYWQQMLSLDPANKLAQTWLENTEQMFAKMQAERSTRADVETRGDAQQKLLNAPISISTERKIPLTEFMNSLSFTTPVELQYSIAQGADTMVFANFVDKPLREVLDTVLLPIGLTWSIDDKNVVVIEPRLISRTYKLSPEQMSQIRALMDAGNMQRIIWGQTESPAPGVDMTLDERQNILVVTGSDLHIKKVENFLPSLQVAQGTDLVMKIYKIRPEDGPRIKSLINSIIAASPTTPFDLERKIFVDNDDLIIRDTPENITKIEELLLDQNFIANLRDEKLDIQNFSLVPKDVENVQSDQIRVFTSRVVEAIKVFLYNTEGVARASEQGRRLWFDEATLQLTVVDTPTNLQRVAEYIESLPELRQRSLQKVRFLKFAVAEDLAGSLERILDLAGDGGGGAVGGTEGVFKLRRGEERQFRNIRIRVIRVEENDVQDRNDDTVELSVNVPGTGPQNSTLTELDSQVVDDYEFTAEDVLPSSGNPGEGSARIRVRYIPRTTGEPEALTAEAQTAERQTSALEDAGITINPFGDLNALIIRYTNPALYQDVEDLIVQLDQPTKQVEIETKFVEVNETRAKEFSSDFNIAGLGKGRDVDWDNQLINTRFAQNLDEFRDPFSPGIESPTNANLIKGTTALGAVFGGGGIPQIEYNLRLLEAEGILNIVNGPKVMSLNGEEAEFRIEQIAPTLDEEASFSSGTTDETLGGNLLNLVNPLDQAFEDLNLADQDEATPGDGGLLSAVVLRVTPSITSEDSIILRELTAEIIDFDGWLGASVNQALDLDSIQPNQSLDSRVVPPPPSAVANIGMQRLIKRKKIITYARIANGGTIVIGGWTGERSEELTSGIPVLRNMPYLGKLLFSRNQRSSERTTLLIFLTGILVD